MPPRQCVAVRIFRAYGTGDIKLPSALHLVDLTWQDIASHVQSSDAIIIPVGAVEQHGPSCPLGTDTFLALDLAARVAERSGILVGPCIPIGDSLAHTAFPGTIALRPSTLMRVVYDYVTSLHRSGFRRFLLLGAHWENHGPIASALSEVADKLHNVRFVVCDFWDFPSVSELMNELFDETGGHADAGDVSLLLAMDPALVRHDLLTAEFPPAQYQVGRHLLRSFMTDTGVIGSDQRKGSVEAGLMLRQAILEGYDRIVAQLLQ